MTSTQDRGVADALAHTTGEIARTDTKAGALLTLDGLLVAALSLMDGHPSVASVVLAVIGGLALVAGVIGAVLVIRPRVPRDGGPDKGSFAYFAQASETEIRTRLNGDNRVVRLQALSEVALRKMRALRVAGDATLVAVAGIAAAILTR